MYKFDVVQQLAQNSGWKFSLQ